MSQTNTRETSRALLAARVGAVLLTTGVGAASFALSFVALRDLAVKAHVAADLAWLWPLIIDGTILLATLGVVVLAAFPEHCRDRRYFWCVLGCSAAVSIVANTLHAIVPADQPLNAWLTGFIGGVAPVSLLATTHGLVILTRAGRHTSGDSSADLADDDESGESGLADEGADEADGGDAPVSFDQYARWREVAAAVLDREPLRLRASAGGAARRDDDVAAVAKVLHLSYDRACTNRDIGRRLELNHHTVAKILATSSRLLREGQFSVAAAS